MFHIPNCSHFNILDTHFGYCVRHEIEMYWPHTQGFGDMRGFSEYETYVKDTAKCWFYEMFVIDVHDASKQESIMLGWIGRNVFAFNSIESDMSEIVWVLVTETKWDWCSTYSNIYFHCYFWFASRRVGTVRWRSKTKHVFYQKMRRFDANGKKKPCKKCQIWTWCSQNDDFCASVCPWLILFEKKCWGTCV